MSTFYCIPSAVFSCGNRAVALLSALWTMRDVRFDSVQVAFVYKFAFRITRPGWEHMLFKSKRRPAFGWLSSPVDFRVVRLEAMMRRLDEVEILLDITHWQGETPSMRAFRRKYPMRGDMTRLSQWSYMCRRRTERDYKWRSRLVSSINA